MCGSVASDGGDSFSAFMLEMVFTLTEVLKGIFWGYKIPDGQFSSFL